jgi:uncharacterized membrane protein
MRALGAVEWVRRLETGVPVALPNQWLFALTLLSALGCGLVGGVFFAFSTFVMKALSRLPAGEGIAAMQSINIAVINPWFMVAFLGTAATSLLAVAAAARGWHEPGAACLLIGGVLYLVGSLLVTMVFNVPRNNALAALAPTDPRAADLWVGYVASWTGWNHVRTIAALAAAAAFSVALAARSTQT